jgi:hypothetical protein
MLTPYVVSPEYNAENNKLEKSQSSIINRNDQNLIELSSLKSSLRVRPTLATNTFDKKL